MRTQDIEQLIPHRDRMKLICAIFELDNTIAVTSSIVKEEWPLYSQGSVDAIILIEVVAQSAGVLASWKKGPDRANMEGGLLTGIKNAEFFVDRIPLNTELTTTVNTLYSVDDYEAMEGTVRAGKQLLGKIQLQIFGVRVTEE
jgi:predicted hotdog family 3-hydroxylacyl-ACP dehydratase